MDTKGLQKEFINWCKSKNKQPKSEDETKQLFVAFMKEKHPEEYKQAMENQQKQQTTKALHGAKLNYFKSLKHQCAEDEEVVYYKKGGSVTCGCKKKEHGGEVPSAKDGTVAKFKNRKNIPAPQQQINPNDTIHVNGQIKSLTNEPIKDKNNTYKPLTPEEYKKLKDKDKNRVDEKDAARGRQVHKCGGKVKKGEDGLLPIKSPKGKPSKNINRGGTKSKLPVQSKGSKINKDCGGAVAKFKALRNGGSLNGIPFYRGGTPKEGIEKSDNTTIQKPFIPYTLVKPQQLPQITVDGIRRINLPNFTVIGQNLNKTYPFPYGEIIVEKSPENGKTISYPTTNSPLGQLVMKSKAIRNARGNRDGEIF